MHAKLCTGDRSDQSGNISQDKAFVLSGQTVDQRDLQANGYRVPTEHANSVVSLRIYHDHIAAVADGVRVAAHPRCFDRSQTFYDWQHYISLLERKPGGLRNGAPFETMPAAFKQLQAILVRKSGGDTGSARLDTSVPVHGLDAVLVAAELALESGKPSGEHVLNVLARLKSNTPAANLGEAMAAELVHLPLKLRIEPTANAWPRWSARFVRSRRST